MRFSMNQKKFYALCLAALTAGEVIDIGMHVLNLMMTPVEPKWQLLYKAGLFGVSGLTLGGLYNCLSRDCVEQRTPTLNV